MKAVARIAATLFVLMFVVGSADFASAAQPNGNHFGNNGNNGNGRGVSGAPAPIAGAGLPVLAVGFGVYWLIRRRRKAE